MGLIQRALALSKAILLLLIGILVTLYLLYPSVISSVFRKSNGMKSNYGYEEAPYLSRKLLGYIWTQENFSNSDVPNSSLKRIKRGVLASSDNTEHPSHPTSSSRHGEMSQHNVFVNGNGDNLEWKINVHVVRHPAKLDQSTVYTKSLDNLKIARNVEHSGDAETQENGHLIVDGLGMKLLVEGRGDEPSSYQDLQKAWGSVWSFINNFFERKTENNTDLENTDLITENTDLIPLNTTLQTPLPQQSLLSNKSELPNLSLLLKDSTSSLDIKERTIKFQTKNPKLLEITEIPNISGEKIFEEGFLEATGLDLQTSQEPSVSDVENIDEIELANSTERNIEPRFMFNFFNRGSGDFEAPVTNASHIRGRESRFLSRFFRTRQSQTDATELGSGDHSEDSVENGRSSRVELDHLGTLDNTSFSDIVSVSENLNLTFDESTSWKSGRSFPGEFGSGDSRALVVSEESEYTTLVSAEHETLPYTERISDTLKTELSNSDYFLETFTESVPLKVEGNVNVSDYDDSFDAHAHQFDHAINDSEYGLENEAVLFQSARDNSKETTEIPETTQQLNARWFFGGLFSEGSGDELFPRMKIEQESQTLLPMYEFRVSEENKGLNDSVLGELNDYENSHPESLSEAETRYTLGVINTNEIKQTEVSVETKFVLEENAPLQETDNDHVSPDSTTQPEKQRTESYFIDYQSLNAMYDSVQHSSEFVTTFTNSYRNLGDEIFPEHEEFSSGDMENSNEGPVALEPERQGRLLDDYSYSCDYPECLENTDNYDNESLKMEDAEFSEHLDSRELDTIYVLNNFSIFEPRTAETVNDVESEIPLTSTTSDSAVNGLTLISILDMDSDEHYKSYANETSAINPYDSDKFNIKQSEKAGTTKAPFLTAGLSTIQERGRNMDSTTKHFSDLSANNHERDLSYSPEGTITSRPQTPRCKKDWQCNMQLNERCINETCACGRSFARHPSTGRCEAIAIVEAVLRFPGESYHKELENQESERYHKTVKAAKDTMKTLLQENAELASTVIDAEVSGFKPGSLVVSWNLIVPVDGNESMDVIVDKVDHGLKEALHSTSVLQKLPFRSSNVDVLQVHRSEVDPCMSSNLNYCSDNAICLRANSLKGFRCQCKDGFLDESQDPDYPGEICQATCVPDYCGEHGTCEITKEGIIKCNCQDWFLGDRCDTSGVVMVGSAATALILLVVVGLMACIVWRHKRSFAYGSDVEGRFQRTEEYGLDRKSAKALGDVLPMEERSFPSHFSYVGNTPNPYLKEPKVPKITVTSPTVSGDVSTYDYSDSTFDSMKS